MIKKKMLFLVILIASIYNSYGQKLLNIEYKCEIVVNFDTINGPSNYKNTFKNSLNKSKLLNYLLEIDDKEKTSSFSIKKTFDPSISDMDLLLINQFTSIKGEYVFSNGSMFHIYEILGKKLNVVVSKKIKWTLTKDIKIINDYKCYKAIGVFKCGKDKGNSVEAWYTDEIPLSYGPKIYNGLSGLIIQLKEKNYTLIVKNIKYVNKVKINFPKKDELLTEKQADSILTIMEENAKSFLKN